MAGRDEMRGGEGEMEGFIGRAKKGDKKKINTLKNIFTFKRCNNFSFSLTNRLTKSLLSFFFTDHFKEGELSSDNITETNDDDIDIDGDSAATALLLLLDAGCC